MLRVIFFPTVIFLCLLRLFRHYSSRRIRMEVNELYKLQRLKQASLKRRSIIDTLKHERFDILVVGGGCIGTGCALDAASRGLRVALVESLDFGAEASSKSTKLLHGGVRYLEKALCYLSIPQLLLVMDALNERKMIMGIAPYLTRTVRIMVPIYRAIKIPFFYVLLKLYDWLSWGKTLGRSYLLSREHTSLYFTNLKKEDLKCSMVYHDGMMVDVRINVALATTAVFYGAVVANHVEFTDFIKAENGRITGARVKDRLSGEVFDVDAGVVMSCVGAFTDAIRQKNSSVENMMVPSMGTHIIIEPSFGVDYMGILDSSRVAGRVIFMLPWNNHLIVGSTESSNELSDLPIPTEDDVDLLISEANIYMDRKITRKDVSSAWKAARPLIKEGYREKTEGIVRKFKVLDEGNGLVVVTGGKWTTFRLMAERAVNMVIKRYNFLAERRCLTSQIPLVGARRYTKDLFYEISRVLNVDIEYAQHLLGMYGDRAFRLQEYIKTYPERLSEKYLFTAGEAIYCIEHELAMNSSDIINNRFNVGYYDVVEAKSMIEKVDVVLTAYFKEKNIEYAPDQAYTKRILDSLGYELISRFKADQSATT